MIVSSNFSLSFSILHQNSMCIFLSPWPYCPSYRPWFDYVIIYGKEVRIINLLYASLSTVLSLPCSQVLSPSPTCPRRSPACVRFQCHRLDNGNDKPISRIHYTVYGNSAVASWGKEYIM
jgi:hypothetical protein